jgi:hypothetical protein
MAVEETTYNSQINLVKFIRSNPDIFNSDDFDNLTIIVQAALSKVASNKQWFTQVYRPSLSYTVQQASRCVDCFTVFDVNYDYNIFVAGVDTLGKANPSVQFHSWV